MRSAISSQQSAIGALPPRRRVVRQVIVALALATAVRLPLMQWPMGASAGTVAYVGQRWLAGAVPYRDAWDHRPPGLYLMSGVAVRLVPPLVAKAEEFIARAFVGAGSPRITAGDAMPEACRLAMLAVDLGALLLLYAFVRQWCAHAEAVVAAGICGFFGGAFLVQGDCLGAGPPVCLLVSAAMLAALRSEGSKARWLAASGLACGLAACFDLLALLYALAIVVWSAVTTRPQPNGQELGAEIRNRRLHRWLIRPAVVFAAALLPFLAFAAWFWSRGALGEFWRSAVVYNVHYRWFPMAMRTPAYHWQVVRSLAPEQGALWLFAVGWLLHAFSMGFSAQTRLVALWAIAAVGAALVTRQLETAQFLQVVPPMAVGAALAVTNPSEQFLARDARGRLETRSIVLALLAVGLAAGFLYTEVRAYRTYASRDEDRADRAAASVADMVRDRTAPGQPIYVWGMGPQLYVLANRPAAHRIFYNRPLNVPWVVKEFFGTGVFDDITAALVRSEPPFFVTTEAALPDDWLRKGPLRRWFQHMHRRVGDRDRYELWRHTDTGPYAIYIRTDRALAP